MSHWKVELEWPPHALLAYLGYEKCRSIGLQILIYPRVMQKTKWTKKGQKQTKACWPYIRDDLWLPKLIIDWLVIARNDY